MKEFLEYLHTHGMSDLADQLGIRYQAIQQWRGVVPPARCLAVERITGISRYRLRPDIYGDMPKRKEAA